MFTKRTICVATAVAGCLLTGSGIAEDKKSDRSHPLDPFLKIAKETQSHCEKLRDYTAIFRKMEVLRGKRFPSTMSMKFREKPFSVYLYFIEQHRGRQVLFVEGQNDGKIVARQPTLGGLGVTVTVDPKSKKALEEGRYPITEIGIANMLKVIIEQWQMDKKYDDVKVTFYPNAQLKRPDPRYRPMDCKVLESKHTKRHKDIEFHITRVYIDKKSKLPVRVEQYGFPRRAGGTPPLLGEYTYWNVKANVGLKDAEFDRKNPKYKF